MILKPLTASTAATIGSLYINDVLNAGRMQQGIMQAADVVTSGEAMAEMERLARQLPKGFTID